MLKIKGKNVNVVKNEFERVGGDGNEGGSKECGKECGRKVRFKVQF